MLVGRIGKSSILIITNQGGKAITSWQTVNHGRLPRTVARPQKDQSKDEFETYICQTPCAVDPLIQFDAIEWWWNNQGTFPTLYQDALDMLAIPAISAECERVFSSAKKMITAAQPACRGHYSGL
jgi:hypothetical protein